MSRKLPLITSALLTCAIGVTFFFCTDPTNPFKPISNIKYKENPATYTVGRQISPNMITYIGEKATSIRIDPALANGLNFDSTTGTISGIPSDTCTAATFTVSVTNSYNTATANVTITINPPPPESLSYSTYPAAYTKGAQIIENRPSWKGGTPTMFSVSPALPAGLELSTTSGIIHGTPTAETQIQAYTISAANNGGTARMLLIISVSNPSPQAHRPQIVSGTQNVQMLENGTYTVRIVAGDADTLDSLRFSLVNADSLKALFQSGSAITTTVHHDTFLITFSPGTRKGNFPFTVRISDGTDSVSSTFYISVGNVNKPPQWNRTQATDTINEGGSVVLSLPDSCTDPEGKALTFALQSGMPGSDTIDINRTYRYTPGYGDSGSYVIRITATDDSGLASTYTLNLRVLNVDPDHTPPSIRLLDPATDSMAVSDNSRMIRIIAKDSSGVLQVSFTYNNLTIPGVKSEDSIWSATVSGLRSGVYNLISIQAQDKSTNPNVSQSFLHIKYDPVMQDNTPPAIRPVSGVVSDTLLRVSRISGTFSITDNSGMDSIYWTLNDTFAGQLVRLVGDSNQYTFVDTLPHYRNNKVSIVATDKSTGHNKGTLTFLVNYNTLPSSVVVVSPANGAQSIEPSGFKFIWRKSLDLDGDSISYQIKYGTDDKTLTLGGLVADTTYSPLVALKGNTVYYWRIYASAGPDTVATPSQTGVCAFTTINHRPALSAVLPAKDAAGVSVAGTLAWHVSETDGDAYRTKVYFGTQRTSMTVHDVGTAETYDPGTLVKATQYFWKLVSAETTSGAGDSTDTMSFWTANDAPVWATIPVTKDTGYYKVSWDLARFCSDPNSHSITYSVTGTGCSVAGSILNFTADSQLITIKAKDNFSTQPCSATTSFRAFWFLDKKMKRIPAGTFTMGSSFLADSAYPSHQVTLSAFWMDSIEMTGMQFLSVMRSIYNNNHVAEYNPGNTPSYSFTWYDAILYCNVLSKLAGLDTTYAYTEKNISVNVTTDPMQRVACSSLLHPSRNPNSNGYRLPTEAEWEYACRSGTQSTYFWGEDSTITPPPKNAWGLYGMPGSIAEMCQDWYGPYQSGAQVNPTGSLDSNFITVRPGTWPGDPTLYHSASRYSDFPFNLNSFRIVRPAR